MHISLSEQLVRITNRTTIYNSQFRADPASRDAGKSFCAHAQINELYDNKVIIIMNKFMRVAGIIPQTLRA
jgi:hypothetical protein